ncbi:hypothetical protein [Methylobacterium nodulans]|uniref:hypothetical protein n=1 Tax=Methylobacterium nodulans TaxID=114616 RepID=UPI0012ED1031|nr:hypothetical protein [Methylobacterium nodulans]
MADAPAQRRDKDDGNILRIYGRSAPAQGRISSSIAAGDESQDKEHLEALVVSPRVLMFGILLGLVLIIDILAATLQLATL